MDGVRLSGLNVRLCGLNVRLSGLNVQLNGLTVRLSGLNVRLSGLNVRLSELNVQLSGLNVRLSGLNHPLRHLVAGHEQPAQAFMASHHIGQCGTQCVEIKVAARPQRAGYAKRAFPRRRGGRACTPASPNAHSTVLRSETTCIAL
jgi:hypothetical protein